MFTSFDFKRAYSEYVQFCRDLDAKSSPVSGILRVFGLNRKPANDPGHERFFTEMQTALKEVINESPDSDTAASILDVVFHARSLYADEPVSPYMMIAVEGAAIGLIPCLSKDKAEEMYRQYKAANPRHQMLPVQKDILKALDKAASLSK